MVILHFSSTTLLYMHVKEVEYDNDCRKESNCLQIAQLLYFTNELNCI